MDTQIQNNPICIIGTGDFGRAIGKRLLTSGYSITFGSRCPCGRNLGVIDSSLQDVQVLGLREAITSNKILIFAIRFEHFADIASKYKNELRGKVVVDVSNRSRTNRSERSNAEVLQELLPDAMVVKGFNVISAYVMEYDFVGNSRSVPIASNDNQARMIVKDIARNIGFQPQDAGMLVGARSMEKFVTRLFPMWRFPIGCATVVFLCWWFYITYLYFIRKTAFKWEQLFVKLLNKPLAMTAITIFALTYLPGCLAGLTQLKNGTKHKRFPNWLDFWLKSRKQLGLTAFALACLHAFISAMLLSPTYYRSWFHRAEVIIPRNITSDIVIDLPVRSWMIWKGEIACLLGILTLAVFCILALTSLSTVSETMNWVEWRFVQSKLGICALFLAVAHAYVMGVPAWVKNNSFIYMFHSITFMSSLLPSIVLVLRFILALPFISTRLKRIRRGWEEDVEASLKGTELVEKYSKKSEPENNSPTVTNASKSGNGVSDKECFCVSNRTPQSNGRESEEAKQLYIKNSTPPSNGK